MKDLACNLLPSFAFRGPRIDPKAIWQNKGVTKEGEESYTGVSETGLVFNNYEYNYPSVFV